jgi:helicase
MDIGEAQGPGVDGALIAQMRQWGITALTDIQVRALDAGIAEGRSMIVSAPTSSGKTLVGEIALLTALKQGTRAIYLVSHKALADQKYLDFTCRFGEKAAAPIAAVGLSTGDRDEGDADAALLVATYEKALGLIVTGQLNPANALVVADELQILGEPGRGPDIEALCSILRMRGIRQFVALSATVENPDDLAGWMECALVQSRRRDVPLHQEVWYENRAHRTTFGQDVGREVERPGVVANDILGVVHRLIETGRGPVLVFTETRRETTDYANAFGERRQRSGHGIHLAEQLDLFSEPTESSDQLKKNAERGVAFHSADLSPQERQVIEAGIVDAKFDVCFATSTLAAGVNFPFRSIVFPKLTYQYGDRQGTHITRSDYRNMSGRAGRLGMHEDGYAVLLPRNSVELQHANRLVLPENDRLTSQLINLSLRKSILMLVASRIATSFTEIMTFFENTLYWYQTLNRNPAKLQTLHEESQAAVEWLANEHLIDAHDTALIATPLGNATALSGLLPTTAVKFANILKALASVLQESFDLWAPGLIYAACTSDEFMANRPSRFLPYPSQSNYGSVSYWTTKSLPVPLDRANTRLAQCAHAASLYVEGESERKIAFNTYISSGNIHRLSVDVAWVLDGLHDIACVPDVGCSQSVGNQIALLARRMRWGAPAEALDVLRIAERHNVPGFGRQRAMALISQGIKTIHDVLSTAREKLTELLRNEHRAQSLLEAASNAAGYSLDRLAHAHTRVGKRLGIEELVEVCNRTTGCDYEVAIASLLRVEQSWIVTEIDDGRRQNVPDLLLKLGSLELLIECKTRTNPPLLVKKEDAWAVVQKAADFATTMRRITLGKPGFDETCKGKVASSPDLTLVEHTVFMEGLLRVHSGGVTATEFVEWLAIPGLTDLGRLGGKSTIMLS